MVKCDLHHDKRFRIRLSIIFTEDDTSHAESILPLNQTRKNDLRINFAGRILDLTEDILFRWRTMLEEGRKSGRTP